MARRIDVPRHFEAVLRKRGVAFTLMADGRYELEQPAIIVSLDNLQRDVARDGNAEAIEVFVDRVLEPPDSRTWAQVRPFVRFGEDLVFKAAPPIAGGREFSAGRARAHGHRSERDANSVGDARDAEGVEGLAS